MITRHFQILIVTFFLFGCKEETSIPTTTEVRSKPLVISLDTTSAYQINPFTGDSIQRPDTESTCTWLPYHLSDQVNHSIPPPGISIRPEKVVKTTRYEQIDLVPEIIEPKITTRYPGKDSTALPSSFIASCDTLGINWPEPISAAMPDFRDNATKNIRYLGIEHGLNASKIRCVVEDNQGRMWFANYDGGVTRYDGQRLYHFRSENGFPGSTVRAMIRDKQGNVWFGGEGLNLIKYDGQHFIRYKGEAPSLRRASRINYGTING